MEQLADILVQGGGIGLAFGALLYTWKKDELYNKTINNHLEHMQIAVEHETLSKIELSKSIALLADKIAGCTYRNQN